jgi:hypothetical protein
MALTHIGVMAMCALLPLAMQSTGCHSLCPQLVGSAYAHVVVPERDLWSRLGLGSGLWFCKTP